ncbi:uncharacterized protein MELLADRAFT_77474 [Melampsora larici-populina 98AG31]|uniref:HhH-GPD domain-containing protein n=1 Tax=Melampsora larici-populina (strain 98AG31 / pathotype 3-4-7) TaxID=747676 RepID=F4RI43_MELLP|nr:uncharacterized protein MELLADRAFT_77474 [Melampsora larici-populina 98AG31]EGG07935.1 hypothetical protein MELLADRAFT_77474 [Melampsora larici-populina 98AG31]
MPSTLASFQSAPMSRSSTSSSLTSLESDPPSTTLKKPSISASSSTDQKPKITPPTSRSSKTKTRPPLPYPTPDIKPSISNTPLLSTQHAKPSKKTSKQIVLTSSPFPNFPHPTLFESQEVCKILSNLHGGTPKRPEKSSNQISPNPKINNLGTAESCGEVSNILEALIRTILSQNTSTSNSNRAYSKIIERYGNANFEDIRKSGIKELTETIRVGGLAERKSKVIITILNQIISKGDGILSLDKLRLMSDEQVMQELVEFDGVGIKTGACVSMFCLGRDTFPVDTHVHRLSKSLGWVPPKATRDQTFFHLNLQLPNDLKYALHILLIRHGQSCRQCSPTSKAPINPTNKSKKKIAGTELECPLTSFMTSKS